MKSAIFYTYDKDITLDEDKVTTRRFHPCGDHTLASKGFVAPLGEELLYKATGKVFGKVKFENKDVPSSVVKELTVVAVSKVSEEAGRKLSKKEVSGIQEGVVHKLLPKCFTKSKEVLFVQDIKNKLLVIINASPKQADDVVAMLREVHGTLPVQPLSTEEDPINIMTDALVDSSKLKETNITLGGKVQLEDNQGNKVSWTEDLHSASVNGIIEEGKTVSKMAIEVDGLVELTVDQHNNFSGIKISKAIMQKPEEDEDPIVAEEANLLICADELIKVRKEVNEWFGGITLNE